MGGFSTKALLAVTFWGLSFVATRIALDWLTPLGLVAARLAVGSATMWLLSRAAGEGVSLQARDRRRCVGLGAILAVHMLIQSEGLRLTSASNTGWIIGFIPITIALGGRAFLGERLPWRGWLGISLGAGGVLLVSLSEGVRFSPSKLGDLLQLGSCLTWTAYTLLAVGPIAHSGARGVTLWSLVAAAAFTIAPCTARPVSVGPPFASAWLAVAFLGVICSGVAYWLWFAALRDVGSSRTGSYLYLEPFVTMIAAWLVLHEQITPLKVAGGGAVLVGVWLVALARRDRGAG